MKVVFLSQGDWAGTGYLTMQAINSTGKVECRQISFYQHEFGYPEDIVLASSGRFFSMTSFPQYEESLKVLKDADFIHLWNCEPYHFHQIYPDLFHCLNKIRSFTFSGSYYRNYHVEINKRLKGKAKIIIQNPNYYYPNEIDSVFIPHAIDLSLFQKPENKDSFTIGCYLPKHRSTTAYDDVSFLEKVLFRKFPQWKVVLKEIVPWKERLRKLSRCELFFEYMDENMGYWGQSAIEACAFGIPTMSYISQEAIRVAGKRLGEIPIINVTRDNLEDQVGKLISDVDYRKEIGKRSCIWVKKVYGFDSVGMDYVRFFESL